MSNSVSIIKRDLSKMSSEFQKALPAYMPTERFIRTAQTAISMTRNIDRVEDTKSLLAAVMKAAADGLILDGREAALVIDYKGNAQYRPMWRGRLKMAYNSGMVAKVSVQVVCENDEFEYVLGDDERIVHKVDLRKDRGEPFAAYATATLKDGAVVREVMGKAQIEKIRDRSDGWKAFKAGKIKDTPWSTDPEEMWRKTVFNRLSKYLPQSSDRDFAPAEDEDDVYHDYDQPAGETAADQVAPTRKKRGGAAAILKDVTPDPYTETDPEFEGETIDMETGEILDPDDQQEDF